MLDGFNCSVTDIVVVERILELRELRIGIDGWRTRFCKR